jgi:hypothetical protein
MRSIPKKNIRNQEVRIVFKYTQAKLMFPAIPNHSKVIYDAKNHK